MLMLRLGGVVQLSTSTFYLKFYLSIDSIGRAVVDGGKTRHALHNFVFIQTIAFEQVSPFNPQHVWSLNTSTIPFT